MTEEKEDNNDFIFSGEADELLSQEDYKIYNLAGDIHCDFEMNKQKRAIRTLKDYKAQILKENPLSAICDDDLKYISSIIEPTEKSNIRILFILESEIQRRGEEP